MGRLPLLEELEGHVLGIFVDRVAVIVFRKEGSHQGRAFGFGQLSLPERPRHIRIRHLCAGMRVCADTISLTHHPLGRSWPPSHEPCSDAHTHTPKVMIWKAQAALGRHAHKDSHRAP